MGSSQFFRANVGALVVDDEGQVLALERSDVPGAWQLPQGGLDEGEDPEDGVLREMEEAIGLGPDLLRILDEHPRWLAYELPPEHRSARHGRGQVQKWYLVRFLGDDRDIDLNPRDVDEPEFGRHAWMRMDELADSAWRVRQPVYRELARHFSTTLAP